MATSDYWSDSDLTALATGGLVNEDVLQKIWDISQVPLAFSDAVGVGKPISATPFGWTTDAQADTDSDAAVVDGQDASTNRAAGGARVQNHVQINERLVQVTERASAVDTIGRANELAYQIGMRQRDNRRNIEATAMTGQASVADNGDATPGKSAGFSAWLTSNDDFGAAPGAAAGYQSATGLVTAVVHGDARVLNPNTIHSTYESAYIAGGNISVLMSRPEVTSRLVKWALANPSAFGIATPTADVNGGAAPVAQGLQGNVSVWVTSFGDVVRIIPNRLMEVYDSGDATSVDVTDLMMIDTGMVELAYLIPEHVEPLGKVGTMEQRQLSTQWGLRVMDQKAHAIIRDILPTGTVAAS